MTEISGLTFDEVWASRVAVELDGRTIAFIGRDALLRNKEASGRLKDLAERGILSILSAAPPQQSLDTLRGLAACPSGSS